MNKKEKFKAFPVKNCEIDVEKAGNFVGISEKMGGILVVTVYKDQKPIFRVFQEKDDFTTLLFSEDRFSKAMIKNLLCKEKAKEQILKDPDECYRLFLEINPASIKTIHSFTGHLSLDVFQQCLVNKKRENALSKRIKKGQQKWIPQVKKGLEKSIKENANPDERFYFFKKDEGGHCSVCGQQFTVSKIKHNEEIICPHCKKKLKAINLRIVKTGRKLTHWYGCGYIFPQAVNGKLILTEYRVVKSFKDGEIKEDYYPLNRIIFSKDGSSELYKRSFCNKKQVSYWKESKVISEPHVGMMAYYYLPKFCRYYDQKELNRCLKKLKMTEYMAAIDHLIGQEDESGLEILTIFAGQYDRKEVLMLLRHKLFQLAGYVIWHHIEKTSGLEFQDFNRTQLYNDEKPILEDYETIEELLGIDKKDVSFVVQNDLTQFEFIAYKKYLQNGIRLSIGQLELVRKYHDWIDDRVIDTRFTKGIGLEKLINYINAQNIVNAKGAFRDLTDYWNLAEQNGESVVLLPKDLQRAHQNQVRIAEEKKKRITKEELREMVHRIRHLDHSSYCFTASNGLVFDPFHSLLEIYIEGKTNHNCIYRNYKERYSKGDTILVGIRKDKHEPYYAMEIRGSEVIQVRGMMNQSPKSESDVQAALREYIKSKKIIAYPRYIFGN